MGNLKVEQFITGKLASVYHLFLLNFFFNQNKIYKILFFRKNHLKIEINTHILHEHGDFVIISEKRNKCKISLSYYKTKKYILKPKYGGNICSTAICVNFCH
jgi:hypothetical protein